MTIGAETGRTEYRQVMQQRLAEVLRATDADTGKRHTIYV